MNNKHGIEIKVGQRWRDCDPRMPGRVMTVVEVDPSTGKVTLARHPELHIWRTKVSARRMHKHSTGWELVSAPAAGGE